MQFLHLYCHRDTLNLFGTAKCPAFLYLCSAWNKRKVVVGVKYLFYTSSQLILLCGCEMLSLTHELTLHCSFPDRKMIQSMQ